MQSYPKLHWFRKDLRLRDQPALSEMSAGIYVLDAPPKTKFMGGASLWWLHHSLKNLSQDIEKTGIPLILRRGDAAQEISDVASKGGFKEVTYSKDFSPQGLAEAANVEKHLFKIGVSLTPIATNLLHDPSTLRTQSGKPFQVYTPFWKALLAQLLQNPPILQKRQNAKRISISPIPGDALEDWNLLPTKPDWAGGLRAAWTPGEKAALEKLEDFLDNRLKGYKENRNKPDMAGTSRLSPHLHFGEISPCQIWSRVFLHAQEHGYDPLNEDCGTFLKEIAWREFSYHLLAHFPQLPEKPLRAQFHKFPWNSSPDLLRAWKKGQTGYPIVDAGMRELRQTGWMHNRVRMITASFLIKHLLIDWRMGEAWFWDNLVDADPASNAASWQWVAGCGADAAPYFRIFNPILQGEKFDPQGDYVRRYVPELAAMPAKWIHKPWMASPLELAEWKVVLGKTYPYPIVDHNKARKRALAAFKSLSEQSD